MGFSTPFIRNPYILTALIAGLVFWLVLFGIVYVALLPLGENVILHLDIQRYIDAIGGSAHLWLLVVGVGIMGLVDAGLAAVLYHREPVLAYIVVWTGAWIMLLGAVVGWILAGIN